MTGSRQIGPLADLVANWAPHFLGPCFPLFGKLGPGKLGPWRMLVWQIGPLQIGPRQIGPLYHKYISIGYILPLLEEYLSYSLVFGHILPTIGGQGCIIRSILPFGMGASGVSLEHVENMEIFSCSQTEVRSDFQTT